MRGLLQEKLTRLQTTGIRRITKALRERYLGGGVKRRRQTNIFDLGEKGLELYQRGGGVSKSNGQPKTSK